MSELSEENLIEFKKLMNTILSSYWQIQQFMAEDILLLEAQYYANRLQEKHNSIDDKDADDDIPF